MKCTIVYTCINTLQRLNNLLCNIDKVNSYIKYQKLRQNRCELKIGKLIGNLNRIYEIKSQLPNRGLVFCL